MTKKVIIIGCGYGGVVSSWRLSPYKNKIEIIVIDKGKNFNFLPLLPDCLGRKIPVQNLCYPIQKLSSIYGFVFLNQEVLSLDLNNKKVVTSNQSLNYDYLIIASGSETNFYGNAEIKKYAYKLDDVFDAEKIKQTLENEEFDSYLIGGGGYTGIEVATNLRVHLNKSRKSNRIVVVERAPSILGPLPDWMKEYVNNNLKDLNIEVLTNTVIEKIAGRDIFLSGARHFASSMLIWAAGVKTADFLQKLSAEKNQQGRIKVDEYLRLNDSCFVIGDASYFSYRGSFLRMAVQFAIAQASLAVYNMINSISGKKLYKYKPFDLGYIIPMANNLSCGNILGFNMSGFTSTLLHYFMSVYRSYGFKNKLGIIGTLTKGGG
jgi:NADH dehydrogenase